MSLNPIIVGWVSISQLLRVDCAEQEKTQVRLPGASKFCSWGSENGSLVVRWASETSLNSLVSDNSSQKQLKNLRLQDEQNNELKALI